MTERLKLAEENRLLHANNEIPEEVILVHNIIDNVIHIQSDNETISEDACQWNKDSNNIHSSKKVMMDSSFLTHQLTICLFVKTNEKQ